VAWIVGIAVGWELVRAASRKFGINLAELRMVIYSVLLITMMLLRPQGLLGGRELWPKRRGPRHEATAADDRGDAAASDSLVT
jgi:hypothetical protein